MEPIHVSGYIISPAPKFLIISFSTGLSRKLSFQLEGCHQFLVRIWLGILYPSYQDLN